MNAGKNFPARKIRAWFGAAFLTVAISLLIPSAAFSDSRYFTPAAGSKERADIMNVIRPVAIRHFGQPVIFTVQVLRVTPQWAFMVGGALQPDGSPIDYTKSPMYKKNPAEVQSEVDGGVLSSGVVALLRKSEGKWRIVTTTFDAGDVSWLDFDKQFGAPSFLIGPLTDEEKAR